MSAERLANRLAQHAETCAVDDPDFIGLGEQRAIKKLIELVERLFGAKPDEVDLEGGGGLVIEHRLGGLGHRGQHLDDLARRNLKSERARFNLESTIEELA